jgi:electron transfer flavoprotein alpha subunit
MAGTVLAVLEQRDGGFRKTAYEVATAAADIASQLGGEAVALVIGKELPQNAEQIGKYGIKKIYFAKSEGLSGYVPEVFTEAVLKAIEQVQPQAVFFSASLQGKDLAPRVAARLGVGLATDCTELTVTDGELWAVRPVYAGKAFVTVRFKGTPNLASLRPNVFTPREAGNDTAAVEEMSVGTADRHYQVKEFRATEGGKIELTEADVIVSGGRGMKGPENFKMLEELAELLGGAVGASRAAVDAGWRPHADQVGQTGKTVSPNLYIAVGISGAIQHLAGMSSSKVIVAINKDPEAPIFSKADYGIVGDLFEVVPKLTEEIRKLKSK